MNYMHKENNKRVFLKINKGYTEICKTIKRVKDTNVNKHLIHVNIPFQFINKNIDLLN